MTSVTENEQPEKYVIEGDTADLSGIQPGDRVKWDGRKYVVDGSGHLERVA